MTSVEVVLGDIFRTYKTSLRRQMFLYTVKRKKLLALKTEL